MANGKFANLKWQIYMSEKGKWERNKIYQVLILFVFDYLLEKHLDLFLKKNNLL